MNHCWHRGPFSFFHPAEEPTWVLLTAPATEADQGAAHQWSLYCRLAATEATCNNQMSSDLRGTKPAPIGTTIPGQCTREVGQLGGLDGFIIKSDMPQNKDTGLAQKMVTQQYNQHG